jgi:hypothetical protein
VFLQIAIVQKSIKLLFFMGHLLKYKVAKSILLKTAFSGQQSGSNGKVLAQQE